MLTNKMVIEQKYAAQAPNHRMENIVRTASNAQASPKMLKTLFKENV
jgi:hypothetical protein